MDEAEYADRIVLMKDGKIIALGAPNELKSNLENILLKRFFKRRFQENDIHGKC
jgi:ABC-type multidrug transport system ATPase subunit